ncbi:hypothetical protein D9758_005514 [Tetrapyrgos nigripes]|uniref:F-box domain-containing protein n=1 Tax=Tetrapyrgos nigripes TaxID=182062 RepID=A0A8H5LPH9_9AGAR|nr:hypothetical protein D9758_005514 [Tetrapyrgos nigripes]
MPPSPDSVVYRIPPEVLEQIFLHCRRDNSIVTDINDAPFNISQICHQWRDIVVQIPHLWSSFPVIFSTTSSRPSLPVPETVLYRSGSAPLSFSLVYRELGGNLPGLGSDSCIFQVFDALLHHISRWETVHLDFPHDTLFPSHFSDILDQTSTLPMLKALSVHVSERHHNGDENSDSPFPPYLSWLSQFAQLAPSLIAYSQYGDGFDGQRLNISPQNITTLFIEHITEETCLNLLMASPCLAECHFARISQNNSSLITLPFPHELEIHTPKLQKLILEKFDTVSFLFRHLVSPNLQHLEILDTDTSRVNRRRSSPRNHFITFLERSACPLTTLSLRPLLLNEGVLQEALALVSPTLVNLFASGDLHERLPSKPPRSLRSYSIKGSLLELLTCTEESGKILCPCLKHITLRLCFEASDGQLSGMIESRWWTGADVGQGDPYLGVCRIERVDIEFSHSNHRMDMEKLKQMFAEGLQGSVRMAPGVHLAPKEATEMKPWHPSIRYSSMSPMPTPGPSTPRTRTPAPHTPTSTRPLSPTSLPFQNIPSENLLQVPENDTRGRMSPSPSPASRHTRDHAFPKTMQQNVGPIPANNLLLAPRHQHTGVALTSSTSSPTTGPCRTPEPRTRGPGALVTPEPEPASTHSRHYEPYAHADTNDTTTAIANQQHQQNQEYHLHVNQSIPSNVLLQVPKPRRPMFNWLPTLLTSASVSTSTTPADGYRPGPALILILYQACHLLELKSASASTTPLDGVRPGSALSPGFTPGTPAPQTQGSVSRSTSAMGNAYPQLQPNSQLERSPRFVPDSPVPQGQGQDQVPIRISRSSRAMVNPYPQLQSHLQRGPGLTPGASVPHAPFQTGGAGPSGVGTGYASSLTANPYQHLVQANLKHNAGQQNVSLHPHARVHGNVNGNAPLLSLQVPGQWNRQGQLITPITPIMPGTSIDNYSIHSKLTQQQQNWERLTLATSTNVAAASVLSKLEWTGTVDHAGDADVDVDGGAGIGDGVCTGHDAGTGASSVASTANPYPVLHHQSPQLQLQPQPHRALQFPFPSPTNGEFYNHGPRDFENTLGHPTSPSGSSSGHGPGCSGGRSRSGGHSRNPSTSSTTNANANANAERNTTPAHSPQPSQSVQLSQPTHSAQPSQLVQCTATPPLPPQPQPSSLQPRPRRPLRRKPTVPPLSNAFSDALQLQLQAQAQSQYPLPPYSPNANVLSESMSLRVMPLTSTSAYAGVSTALSVPAASSRAPVSPGMGMGRGMRGSVAVPTASRAASVRMMQQQRQQANGQVDSVRGYGFGNGNVAERGTKRRREDDELELETQPQPQASGSGQSQT